MRRHQTIGHLLLATLLIGPVPQAARVGWLGPDRVKHFFLSFFIQSAGYSLARAVNVGHKPALIAASGATTAAALSKELWDRKRGTGFDRGDLVWDALGAGAATALLVRTVDR